MFTLCSAALTRRANGGLPVEFGYLKPSLPPGASALEVEVSIAGAAKATAGAAIATVSPFSDTASELAILSVAPTQHWSYAKKQLE